MTTPRFDIENYDGSPLCPCCGADATGDRWANCADAVYLRGMDQAEAHAKYCTGRDNYTDDLCQQCEKAR